MITRRELSKSGYKNGAITFHGFPQRVIRTYVNSRGGEAQKGISECTSKEVLHPVSLLGSSEVLLLCGAQSRVRSEVRSRLLYANAQHTTTLTRRASTRGRYSNRSWRQQSRGAKRTGRTHPRRNAPENTTSPPRIFSDQSIGQRKHTSNSQANREGMKRKKR